MKSVYSTMASQIYIFINLLIYLKYVFKYIYILIQAYIYKFIYIYIYVPTLICLNRYIYIYCAYIYLYSYMCIYTHTSIHIWTFCGIFSKIGFTLRHNTSLSILNHTKYVLWKPRSGVKNSKWDTCLKIWQCVEN